jgi:cytochrome c oxidase cbb3-type subunit 1
MLLSGFVLSVATLPTFIWSQRRGLLDDSPDGARVIFVSGELGRADEPAATAARRGCSPRTRAGGPGRSAPARAGTRYGPSGVRPPPRSDVLAARSLRCRVGLAIKLHKPDLLTEAAWLSFGRTRTHRPQRVAYGWAPLTGLAVAIFDQACLLATPTAGGRYALSGGVVWNFTRPRA